jgi:Flp pilus assembly protein TadG
MAFVLPIFLVIVMATVDFGMAFREYITITNAAREGARLGITGATSTQMKDRTIQRSNNLSNGPLTATNVTTSCNPTTCATGSEVKVAVEYDYKMITPLAGLLNLGTGSDTIKLKSSTSMRRE